MRIMWGATRLVIAFDRKVIKIARFRPLHLAFLPFALARDKERRRACAEKMQRQGLAHMLFWKLARGIEANRREYRLYLTSKDPRLAPTHASWGFGLVNVQERGERVADEELAREHPFSSSHRYRLLTADATEARQYARIRGVIRLVDYADPLVSELLRHPVSS